MDMVAGRAEAEHLQTTVVSKTDLDVDGELGRPDAFEERLTRGRRSGDDAERRSCQVALCKAVSPTEGSWSQTRPEKAALLTQVALDASIMKYDSTFMKEA